jgi:phosphorylcholine metabolism protein LicD
MAHLVANSGVTPKLDEQLEWILGLLQRHSIPCWVDQGTLLGLAREGRLLDDDDIDIGTWSRYEPRLRYVFDEMRDAGYKIMFQAYARKRCIYSFLPKSRDLRGIDIYLFQEHGDFAWFPEVLDENPYRKGTFSHYTYYLNPYHLVNKLFRFLKLERFYDVSAWPLREVIDVATWLVPKVYFNNLVWMYGSKVPAPRDWQDYLTFRYSDWKTPIKHKDWNHNLDGAFLHMPPWKWIPDAAVCSQASANSKCRK